MTPTHEGRDETHETWVMNPCLVPCEPGWSGMGRAGRRPVWVLKAPIAQAKGMEVTKTATRSSENQQRAGLYRDYSW